MRFQLCRRPALRRGATHPIVFGSNRADGARDLYVVSEGGSGEHRLTFDGDQYFERVASWSPDSTKIVYAARHAGNFDIYTIDADGQNRVQLTTDPRRDDYPEWTSDGRILFTRNLFAGPTTEWVVNADGTGERQLPLDEASSTLRKPLRTVIGSPTQPTMAVFLHSRVRQAGEGREDQWRQENHRERRGFRAALVSGREPDRLPAGHHRCRQ